MTGTQRAVAQTDRTPNDVSALCVELLRAVREQEFRATHQAGPAPSIDRAWRAWRSDLDRHGPLHLVADVHGLHQGEDGAPVGRGRLDELAKRLRDRVLASVIFEPGLDAPTYSAFVSLLVAEPQAVEQHGGAAGFLPERGVGIRVCGPDDAIIDEEKPEPDTSLDIGLTDAERAVADPEETLPGPVEDDPDTTMPMMKLQLAPKQPAAERTLDALSACEDDLAYSGLVARLVAEANEADDAGERCREAMLLLADHAETRSGRSTAQRAAALSGLREIGTGRRLSALLERATGSDPEASLRASRVLVLLSDQAGPALISAIDVQANPVRREELLGIAIALGRDATPALHRAMEGSSPNRARIAARIAGEIRDERAVPTLAKLLDHREADVRGESARALARIGNVTALTTLKRGLDSSHEDVSSLCAYCLGVTGTEDAAIALTETLRQARRARRTALASAVIRSLGRLGREESVPELKRIVQKRSFFRRQELHELKLQSISALAQLPGERAREVLEAVAAGADMSLAVAARRALKERSEANVAS